MEQEKEKELEELRIKYEELKQKVQDYKLLEEDLMAKRVFDKARKQFKLFVTFGGIILILSGVIGIKTLTDYARGLAKQKIDKVMDDEIKESLLKEGKEQINVYVKNIEKEFNEFAQREISRIGMATAPIGRTRTSEVNEVNAAVVSALDYTDKMGRVRYQGDEGSSVGFAVAASLEYRIYKKLGKRIKISVRHIYYEARLKGGQEYAPCAF